MKFLFAVGADVAISVYTWTRTAGLRKPQFVFPGTPSFPQPVRQDHITLIVRGQKKKAYKLKHML